MNLQDTRKANDKIINEFWAKTIKQFDNLNWHMLEVNDDHSILTFGIVHEGETSMINYFHTDGSGRV